jgi:hypothetical protein
MSKFEQNGSQKNEAIDVDITSRLESCYGAPQMGFQTGTVCPDSTALYSSAAAVILAKTILYIAMRPCSSDSLIIVPANFSKK